MPGTSIPIDTPTQQLIGGHWTDGADGSFDVLNPATARVLCAVPRAGAADVTAAAAAQPGWAATPSRERADVLHRAFEVMIARRGELAYLMSSEMGKTLLDARAEVTYAASSSGGPVR
jgi:succinate-semialdehyde dehydrogenase/glutarate-semialdehyde dehydrogenase